MNRRARPLWLVVICLWAVGLTFEAVVRTMLLAVGQTSGGEPVFTLTLTLALVGAVYAAGLVTAAAGMWWRHDWGRRLFLGLLTLYYGSLLVSGASQWGPLVGRSLHEPGQGWLTMVMVEAGGGLAFGWWYLNRNRVKAWFADREEE